MAKQTGPSVKAMLTERNAIKVEVRRVVERSSAVLQCVLIGDLQAKAIKKTEQKAFSEAKKAQTIISNNCKIFDERNENEIR